MALYLLVVDHGHDVFPATDGDNLHGVFGGDNSSRVVELEDDDSIEDNINQQNDAPIYQQPSLHHSPVLGNSPFNSDGHTQGRYVNVLSNSASNNNQHPVTGPSRPALPCQYGFEAAHEFDPVLGVDADSDSHARYRPHTPADATYGTGNGYIQRPGMHYSDNTNANMNSARGGSQQQPPPSNTASTTPSYAYTGTNAYDPAPVVDAGLGARSNVDSSSVYPSQWSSQGGHYNWQRAAQDADVAGYDHGKLAQY